MMAIYKWGELSDSQQDSLLARPYTNNDAIVEKVKSIISDVRLRGDLALAEYTKNYDRAVVDTVSVSEKEFEQAEEALKGSDISCIETAVNRIQRYQSQCIPKEILVDSNDGIVCRKIPTPIRNVGLYVPGGTAVLISTVMMLAIPAKLAGCQCCVLCTPPNAQGLIDPLLLITAKLCGVDRVYKVGGAQAIAAMAYGTESVPKVDKIVGPGNEWVTEAKQQVSNDPLGAAIDMPAGPSEVLVIADETADASFVAADLLSQAEHGAASQVILVTSSESLARDVKLNIEKQFSTLSRKEIITAALSNSRIIKVGKIEEAFKISNQYMPEHLIIQVEQPEQYLESIESAGAVFMGQWAPESMGDYINGANHVLPTYGYANRMSGLSVSDFMKYISVQSVTEVGLKSLGPVAMQLAEIEGLDAHKNAIDIRLKKMDGIVFSGN